MRSNTLKLLVLAMAGTMALSPVCAASSPTTRNTIPATVDNRQEDWIVPRGNGRLNIGGIQVESQYEQMAPGFVTTVVRADKNNMATKKLNEACGAQKVSDAADGHKTIAEFGPYKIRSYKEGVNYWDGFGVQTLTFYFGMRYEGKTVVVTQIHKDGTVTSEKHVVQKGVITIHPTDMGTFSFRIIE